jgi:predicted nucleotidyltransferase
MITNIPYSTAYRTVKRFPTLLNSRTVGKAELIQLNISNKIIINYLAISSNNERLIFLEKNKLISKIDSKLQDKNIVLLFGSYAKGKQTKYSDIDLLIINKKGEKDISFKNEELLFNIKINPIFITKKEFKLMLRDKEENVGKQVLKDHIILKGFNDFWEEVINDVQ